MQRERMYEFTLWGWCVVLSKFVLCCEANQQQIGGGVFHPSDWSD